MWRAGEIYRVGFGGATRGKRHLEDLRIDGRVILKWTKNGQAIYWIVATQVGYKWRAVLDKVMNIWIP